MSRIIVLTDYPPELCRKLLMMEIKLQGHSFVEVFGAVTYGHYLNLIEKLALKKKTSGLEQSEEKINATPINLQRMKRLLKQSEISEELRKRVGNLERSVIWLVITEAWCGDAAQNLPLIQKVAGMSKGRIQLLLAFRDENPELMNNFLTNGSRSIPKLICLSSDTHEVLTSWGPRPNMIQEILNKFKKGRPDATHKEIMYHVHLNYFHDQGQSLQSELSKMLDECNSQLAGNEIRH